MLNTCSWNSKVIGAIKRIEVSSGGGDNKGKKIRKKKKEHKAILLGVINRPILEWCMSIVCCNSIQFVCCTKLNANSM